MSLVGLTHGTNHPSPHIGFLEKLGVNMVGILFNRICICCARFQGVGSGTIYLSKKTFILYPNYVANYADG